MACYKPLTAYKLLNIFTKEHKNRIIITGKKDGSIYENCEEAQYVELPCGQCIGCRLDKARSWALRCMHEASLYDNNCFITLTFDDETLDHGYNDGKLALLPNPSHSLRKSDFQNFMKRLRKNYNGLETVERTKVDGTVYTTRPIRFLHCGEYGENLSRPHHHAILFNFDFLDKTYWTTQNGHDLYRSETLEELWPFGYVLIGDVTIESAGYVARYTTKKVYGPDGYDHYCELDIENGEILSIKEPEYATMSRRPGIGKDWYDRYKTDTYKDSLSFEGKLFKIPNYYDKMHDLDNPENFANIKRKRLTQAKANADNNTIERLISREKVKKANATQLKRSLES